ncbi:MAG: hypothetical protein FJX76_09265 [Armatimonadetes bacterium]|nr:hypothetical protein [Armatimonadota bacterium]
MVKNTILYQECGGAAVPVVKLNISMDAEVVHHIKERAREEGKTMSGYLTDLVKADRCKRLDELADEGYRLLADEMSAFAEAVLPIAMETLPPWDPEEVETHARVRKAKAR